MKFLFYRDSELGWNCRTQYFNGTTQGSLQPCFVYYGEIVSEEIICMVKIGLFSKIIIGTIDV